MEKAWSGALEMVTSAGPPSLGIHSVREFTSQYLRKSRLLIVAKGTQLKVC